MAESGQENGKGRTAAIGDEVVERGVGGESHQVAGDGRPRLTTQQGVVVADDQNTLRVGDRGPAALEDFHFREKIFHFDHERIPERVVHARGYGAHGYFKTYESLADVTRAGLFQRAGQRTPAFVRFSTVAGSEGSADLARDVRGFAVKLYTEEGNWDLVGNNIPVFFIQDAIKFPDLIHAAKPEPDRGFPQAQTAHDNFWDFASLMPESTHMLLWIMSDRAIPRSFRFMEGFGVHTFRFVTADGRSTYVKFHWKPKGGLQSVVWNEAVKINGADPDFHRRDLWDAIQRGDLPEWELGVQLFDDDFADRFPFDILDPTKLIPEEEVPVRRVGRLVLDRVVDNFFAETEQVAFCTQNIVPGIDFTDDPLLQGRNFSYLDTQLKRLGSPNFTRLDVNAPKCPYASFQQDGHMATANPLTRANYEPNSWPPEEGGPREDPDVGFTSVATTATGPKRRIRPNSSPTTTARPASSTGARRPSSSVTSGTPSCSSWASAGGRTSGPGWWAGSGTSTRISPPTCPRVWAWPNIRTRRRPPADRWPTWHRRRASASWRTVPGPSPDAGSGSWWGTGPAPGCSTSCADRPRRPAWTSNSWVPVWAGSPTGTATSCPSTRRSTGPRRCCTTPWWS